MQLRSDVAWMLAQIDAEYAALHGSSVGTARHDFINAKMERTQEVGEQLIAQIGKEQALPLIIDALNKASTGDKETH